MDRVTRRFKGELKVFPIYTTQEADEAGLVYHPWQECANGDWGVSDDGYVAECLQRVEYTDKKKRTKTIVVYPFGRVFTGPKAKLLYEIRRTSRNFYSLSNKPWVELEAKKTRTKNAVSLYVQMLLGGRINWVKLGKAYRPDQLIPEATVRRLFKQDRIKKMVNDELKTILENLGITQEDVLKTYQKAIQLAQDKGDASAMIKGADRLAPLVGIFSHPKQIGPGPSDEDLMSLSEKLLQHEAEKKQLKEPNKDDGN